MIDGTRLTKHGVPPQFIIRVGHLVKDEQEMVPFVHDALVAAVISQSLMKCLGQVPYGRQKLAHGSTLMGRLRMVKAGFQPRLQGAVPRERTRLRE